MAGCRRLCSSPLAGGRSGGGRPTGDWPPTTDHYSHAASTRRAGASNFMAGRRRPVDGGRRLCSSPLAGGRSGGGRPNGDRPPATGDYSHAVSTRRASASNFMAGCRWPASLLLPPGRGEVGRGAPRRRPTTGDRRLLPRRLHAPRRRVELHGRSPAAGGWRSASLLLPPGRGEVGRGAPHRRPTTGNRRLLSRRLHAPRRCVELHGRSPAAGGWRPASLLLPPGRGEVGRGAPHRRPTTGDRRPLPRRLHAPRRRVELHGRSPAAGG